MKKYKCVLGVKVGDKVHLPGEVIDLTDEQAVVCLRKRAVVPAPEPAPSTTPAPAAAKPAKIASDTGTDAK